MDKTQEHYEKDTKLNTDQPPPLHTIFPRFRTAIFFVFSDSFICSTMGCVVENAASQNMVFLYVLVSSAGKCLRQAYHAVTGFPRKRKGKLYAGLWVFPWPHEWGIVLLS